MSSSAKSKLPPNPYKRSPIKKRADLAGRARELKTIRYYLGLTASGQSPHLALIGQRGVGKTSLLNGAESIAKDLKLLPVRLDMNELKAKSPGRFWYDLYQALCLSMAKVGCWGGVQGTIYAELLRMIHARQPGSLEKAVLQVPYVFSCHQGSIENFECPDALVVSDFEACLEELKDRSYAGIALLIDEADCLGKNVPLLQMFRNIFQTVERCSLLLAGTEAVFPALSEVFSPIPRQFHRMDIKPFARWSDTMELVLGPISADIIKTVGPEAEVIQDLHHLCGGAPDEVQLYCHHMYRSAEDGTTKRMSLVPQVFREVLREYRSNTPANVDAILNAIERLPDKLLYQSKWLSRRNLTLDENIRVSVLRRELKHDRTLSADERSEATRELTEGYRKLFEAGITEGENCIRLAGAPLTAGFWKSFVNLERRKQWAWDDDSYADNLHQPVMNALGRACGAVGHLNNTQGRDAVTALRNLREGKTPPESDEGMGEMIVSALFARENKATHVSDITFQIESPAGKQTLEYRFFEKIGVPIRQEQIQEWIDVHRTLLAGNGISVCVAGFDRWELPSTAELHRLGRIADHRIPEVFGPTEAKQAIERFADGDVAGCMEIFKRMLADKEESYIRNNLAFCQILTGDITGGFENATRAVKGDYEPIFELNKGIAESLQGNNDAAKQSLRNALQQLRDPERGFDTSAYYVLVLEPSGGKVSPHDGLPIDAALLINLWRLGSLSQDDLEKELLKLYPEDARAWLAAFPAP